MAGKCLGLISWGIAALAKQHDTRIDGELWRFAGVTNDRCPVPGLEPSILPA